VIGSRFGVDPLRNSLGCPWFVAFGRELWFDVAKPVFDELYELLP
jgi:hypothetical protein